MHLEEKLIETLAKSYDAEGQPKESIYTLTRCMDTDEEDQFDVDMTIMDYLIYKALDLVIAWRMGPNPYSREGRHEGSGKPKIPMEILQMIDDWRVILKHRYLGRALSNQVAFRSRLLQFVLVWTHRFWKGNSWTTRESIAQIDEQNKRREHYWTRYAKRPPAVQQPFDIRGEFPLSESHLHEHRLRVIQSLGIPLDDTRWVTDSDAVPPLQCLLPLFIELTGSRVKLDDDWVPTSQWYELAAEFMQQAVLEEYLRNDSAIKDADTLNIIYSFGCPGIRRFSDSLDITTMRSLFSDEDDLEKEHSEWTRIKQRSIQQLLPKGSSNAFVAAFEKAQEDAPWPAFERKILLFLQYLHEGTVKPDLVQVEEGRITINGQDLSSDESKEMIQRMRL